MDEGYSRVRLLPPPGNVSFHIKYQTTHKILLIFIGFTLVSLPSLGQILLTLSEVSLSQTPSKTSSSSTNSPLFQPSYHRLPYTHRHTSPHTCVRKVRSHYRVQFRTSDFTTSLRTFVTSENDLRPSIGPLPD